MNTFPKRCESLTVTISIIYIDIVLVNIYLSICSVFLQLNFNDYQMFY